MEWVKTGIVAIFSAAIATGATLYSLGKLRLPQSDSAAPPATSLAQGQSQSGGTLSQSPEQTPASEPTTAQSQDMPSDEQGLLDRVHATAASCADPVTRACDEARGDEQRYIANLQDKDISDWICHVTSWVTVTEGINPKNVSCDEGPMAFLLQLSDYSEKLYPKDVIAVSGTFHTPTTAWGFSGTVTSYRLIAKGP